MNGIIEKMRDVAAKISFLPNDELRLAFLGGILTVVFFILAYLISFGSKMSVLRKKIQKLIVKIAGLGRIDETNVAEVYEGMQELPSGVKKGWGNFLDQRNGYPSDYMSARDCIGGAEYSGKYTFGKIVFTVLCVILWAFFAIVTPGVCAEDLEAFGIADITKNFGAVASVLGSILIPIALFVIGYFVLCHLYFRQRKRLEMCFTSLQDIIDERTLVAQNMPSDYEEESLEALKAKVDALIDGRMDEDGVIEVLRLPDGIEEELPACELPEPEIPAEEEEEEEPAEEPEEVKEAAVDEGIGDLVYPDEEEEKEEEPVEEEAVEEVTAEPEEETEEAPEEVEEATEEEPVEEPVEEPQPEPEPEPIILTEEEEKRYLSILPGIVEQAVNDPETTLQDLEELAELIENARLNNFKEQADQDILIECLCTIADKYYQS